MSDRQAAVERVAERTWDRSIAGGEIPAWAELDEGSKRRWRGSLNVSMGILGDAVDELLEPLDALVVRALNWLGRKRSSAATEKDSE